MKNIKLVVVFLLSIVAIVPAQHKLLSAGPMLGYSEMREVGIWLQTTESAKVKIEYFAVGNSTNKFLTNELTTKKEEAFTAKLIAENLEPGSKYAYKLFINSEEVNFPYATIFQTQTLWQFRTDPPEFTFATGSCAYINEPEYDRPGTPYGSEYEIFKSISAKHPDFMVWLGDNVYLREADFYSNSGIFKRYTHDRAIKEWQELFATSHNYAIWDDHDFGPNDSDRGFRNKYATLKAFKLFWANPAFGNDKEDGTNFTFQWGDAEFFMLDNRFHRSPDNRKTGVRTILGENQFQWLIDQLAFSQATFKIICIGGQVINPVANYENYAIYPEERGRIIQEITKEGIKGVIFLTGDRHHTELSKLDRKDTYPLYDFTISPFTAGYAKKVTENNTLRVAETMVNQHNFALFNFTGKKDERLLTVTVCDKDGKILWDYKIKSTDLGYQLKQKKTDK